MKRPRLDPGKLLREVARGKHPASVLAAELRRRRRLLLVAVAAALAVLGTSAAMAVAVFVSSPAAAPVAITATVLSPVIDLFDDSVDDAPMTGEQLAAAGHGDAVTCLPVPAAAQELLDATPATADDPEKSERSSPEQHLEHRVDPIVIGSDGSIDRADTKELLAPLEQGTSTLVAHVWFLYRLAGMGDWDAFTAGYRAKGLQLDDEAADAPLQQVQALNTAGVEVDRYRLTAASLAAAGQYTGRFHDPYPGYRELVAMELAATCLGEAETLQLPPPSTEAVPTPNR